MLVEQVLHIMLNQDNPRSLCFFRPQITTVPLKWTNRSLN